MLEFLIPAIIGALAANGRGGAEMSSQSTQQMPEWQENLLSRLGLKAEDYASEPYVPYAGPRIAGFTPMQERSFQAVDQAAQAANPYSQWVNRTVGELPGRWNQSEAQKYMNPFTNEVINRSMSEIDRQGAISRRDLEDRLIRSGNFTGGDRRWVAEAEHARGMQDVKANTIADLNQNNYFQAMQQFNADRGGLGQLAQTVSGLGGQQQDQALRGASALGTVGSLQQAQNQANLDLAYGDFNRQVQHPYKQMEWQSGITRGIPQTGSQTTSYSPQPSPLQQMAGLGLAGFGMFAGAPQGSWANNKMNNWFGG